MHAWDKNIEYWDKRKETPMNIASPPEKGFMKSAIIPHDFIFWLPSSQIS